MGTTITPTNLTPQTDANGFQIPIAYQNYGTNPWNSVYAQDQGTMNQDSATLTQQTPQSQQYVSSLQNQYNAYAGMTAAPGGGSYPTYQNAYGLGSGSAFSASQPVQGSASAPSFGASQVGANSGITDSSSRGFNPWSMTGESNARGK